MAAGLADAIRAVVQDKGISEELLMKVIEEFLIAAYKRKFGHADNAVVQFSDEGNEGNTLRSAANRQRGRGSGNGDSAVGGTRAQRGVRGRRRVAHRDRPEGV
jgi:hypothetical protein